MIDRVYVFDMDDTLYLERDYVRSGFRHIGDVVGSLYGVEGAGTFAWELFKTGVRGNTFDLVAQQFSLPSEATGIMIAEYRDHEPDIALAPDAAAFLADLPKDAIGTGLITDGYAKGQWRKIDALCLAGQVGEIIVTADFGLEWSKPNARAFQLVESRFSPGVEFVYFGDNPAKDFDAPRELGWRCVRVRRPLGLHHGANDRVPVDETITGFPRSWRLRDRDEDHGPRRRSGDR